MRSAVGGHPSLQTTFWSLCGNTLWRIVTSQLQNSAVISHRFPTPCCTKLSASISCSGNYAPGGCQSNWHQNTKHSGTMMIAINFSASLSFWKCWHWPDRNFLRCKGRWKSLGTRSGSYGGWLHTSQLNSCRRCVDCREWLSVIMQQGNTGTKHPALLILNDLLQFLLCFTVMLSIHHLTSG